MGHFLGDIPAWGLLVMAVGFALRLTRGGAGSAVSELDKSNHVLKAALEEERAAHQLTRETMGAEIRDLRVEVANLQGKTDVALAINTWGQQHEDRAAERHAATLNVLEMIAHRLGADGEDD